jgi:mycofactocin precursor
MDVTQPTVSADDRGQASPGSPADAEELLADELVEEISIDGMCGVY